MSSTMPPLFPPALPYCFSSGSLGAGDEVTIVNPGSALDDSTYIVLCLDLAVMGFPSVPVFSVSTQGGETIYAQSEEIDQPASWQWRTWQPCAPGQALILNNASVLVSVGWRASGLVVPTGMQAF